MAMQWSITILDLGNGQIAFLPAVPGAQQNQPLGVNENDLVTWNNTTNNTLTLQVNPAGTYLADPIPPGQVSDPIFRVDGLGHVRLHQPDDAAAQHPDRAAAGARDKLTDARLLGARDHPDVIGGRAMTAHAVSFRRAALMAAAAFASIAPATAQTTQQPTRPTLDCMEANPPFVMPRPKSSTSNGILKGTITLTEQMQRVPRPAAGHRLTCAPQWMRVFQSGNVTPTPSTVQPNRRRSIRWPGPTCARRSAISCSSPSSIRSTRTTSTATSISSVHARRPERPNIYPGPTDSYPNCLHASSTANIHFHGTHTSPSSTGDNVYLQVRPLPRDNQGNVTVTPAQATASLDEWFGICTQQLKNPLNQWPVNWNDFSGIPTSTRRSRC